MPPLRAVIWVVVLFTTPPALAVADPPPLPALIDGAAARVGVAPGVVSAIIWVESRGWPWALNISGAPRWPRSREEARSILSRLAHDHVDIGLMQVNWRTWGLALRRLGLERADLLDPWINLVVGSQILRWAMAEEVGWGGVGRYHSATPWRKHRYAWTVASTWQALRPVVRTAPVPESR